jgi:hypothetical protein
MAAHHPSVPGVRFKDISGFPGYCIGDDGSVWTCKKAAGTCWILSDRWKRKGSHPGGRSGHHYVYLSREGRAHILLVHRLVLEHFVGPCPDGCECCHGDGDPNNNHLNNLRWDTAGSNHADRVRHGSSNRGDQRSGTAILTRSDVIRIKAMIGKRLVKEIAAEFGVHPTTICNIKSGKTWSYVR